MIWIVLAVVALVASLYATADKLSVWRLVATEVFYLTLIAWILIMAGSRAFVGSETGFLSYFVAGLAILALGDLLAVWGGRLAHWSLVAFPVSAIFFALGFDVFRPDPYSYIPATIVGAMILAVAWTAYMKLRRKEKGERGRQKTTGGLSNVGLLLYILAIAILLYSALFKLIDRGWSLPWAYLAGGGSMLFASSQLWLGWDLILKDKRTPEWMRLGAMNLGTLLMVISALFVYREFL